MQSSFVRWRINQFHGLIYALSRTKIIEMCLSNLAYVFEVQHEIKWEIVTEII